MHSTTGQIGVVSVPHGNKLLRRCSEREVSIASLKGLVQVSMSTSVTELTTALPPGQYEDLSTSLPTRDDLRIGEVDLEAPPVDQETMAPPDVPLFPSGTVVTQLQNTPARLSSIPNPVFCIWASVPESLIEAGLQEVLEPSEGDTKKRRVESFDESVDWFQRERSPIAWMTNVSDEREIFEIDVGT